MSNPTNTTFFTNLVTKTFVGINLSCFNSSPNFHGVTNLPTGLHFIYTGTDASLSTRHGHWLRIRPVSSAASQIHILQWNNELECLDLLDPRSEAVQVARRRLPELRKRGLVDYSALRDASTNLQNEQSKSAGTNTTANADADADNEGVDEEESEDHWPALTSHITPRLLSRILGSSTDTSWSITSISSAPNDTEHIPGLNSNESSAVLDAQPSSTLNLLPIDLKQTWPEDAVGRARTEKARDRSWYLGHLIDLLRMSDAGTETEEEEISQQQAARELLGEMQFCFLMVLCLANYSCLEQWKRILSVLFTCRSALSEVEGYFVEAAGVLRKQLERVEDVEGGLFEMGDEMGSRWLRQLLKGFRSAVDDGLGAKQKQEGKLAEALGDLEKWLGETYGWEDEKNTLRRGMVQLEDGEMVELQADGWDEEEETGEYAPVVVET